MSDEPSDAEAPENAVEVTVDGPLMLEGDIEMGAQRRRAAALCRCGKSQTMPFCDGRHQEVSFRDPAAIIQLATGAPGEGEEPPLRAQGKMSVKQLKNGPLVLSGDFSLKGKDGHLSVRGQKLALCRCGASKKKPFCDGSHRDIDFHAE
jgi:CDGSH-type Zn-finger protein